VIAAAAQAKGRGKHEAKAARKQRKDVVKAHDKAILQSTTMRLTKLSAIDRKMLRLTPAPDPMLALTGVSARFFLSSHQSLFQSDQHISLAPRMPRVCLIITFSSLH
jgi:hypothetical protein